MSFFEEIQQKSAQVQQEQEQAERAKLLAAEQEKQARFAAIVAQAKTTVAEEVRDLIRAEAAKGERSAWFNLQRWSDEFLTDYAKITGDVLKAIFGAEGFEVRTKVLTTEPTGSDPLFNTTVYCVDIEFRW